MYDVTIEIGASASSYLEVTEGTPEEAFCRR